jgi:seryl-tRNA synthetase
VLRGTGAHLQRALISWMVDFHVARGSKPRDDDPLA